MWWQHSPRCMYFFQWYDGRHWSLGTKGQIETICKLTKTHQDSLKTTRDFLYYICKKGLQEVYPNLFIALREVITCLISVASAERSFSTLKLIKTFHRSTIMNNRLSSLAILSVEKACVCSLDYNGIIDTFATAKTRKNNFYHLQEYH